MFTLLNAKPVYLGCNLFHRGFVELERSEFKGGAECGYSLNGNIERMSPSYTTPPFGQNLNRWMNLAFGSIRGF
jgi:hypothetical protein